MPSVLDVLKKRYQEIYPERVGGAGLPLSEIYQRSTPVPTPMPTPQASNIQTIDTAALAAALESLGNPAMGVPAIAALRQGGLGLPSAPVLRPTAAMRPGNQLLPRQYRGGV